MRSTSRQLGVLALCSILVIGACDDEDGGTGPGEDVYGVWSSVEDDLFIQIETERITVYDDVGDCFDITVLEILDREGEVFTLQEGDSEVVSTIAREGDDGLVIETEGDVAHFTWQDDDVPAGITEC
jgi:hypothetical protein